MGCYLPGYKFGGPLRTIANMVHHLGDEFNFKIITRDRDLSDHQPYVNVAVHEWQQVGKADVFYCSLRESTLREMIKLLKETPHDILYLNSFFDFTMTFKPLLARFLKLIPSKPVILAPRGEFSKGGLQLKRLKKLIYLVTVKAFGFYNNITWHASSEDEFKDIQRQSFIKPKHIPIAIDLPAPMIDNNALQHSLEGIGFRNLRIVFLSRIVPMKNIDYVLSVLLKTTIDIVFDVYGPIEDSNYWKKCQSLINRLPANIQVRYCGSVTHDEVSSIFSHYDLFFLPSRGENYCHAIAESLSVGTPVLISDRTPWRKLYEEDLGWDLSLENEMEFVRCIEYYFSLTQSERYTWRHKIRTKMMGKLTDPAILEANRALFLNQLT